MTVACAMFIAFALDLALGDPRWLPHPVVGMGRTISLLEGVLRRAFPQTPEGERTAGRLLAAILPIATLALSCAVLALAYLVHPWLAFAFQVIMCYQALATRELWRQTEAVRLALVAGDLGKARQAVSMVVGRDVDKLDKQGVARAAVETIAENASDGVVAPLFFMALGGGPFALAYKAINTMDSMVGYKNDRYLNFGRAAARLDDVANWIPSRLTGFFAVCMADVCGLSAPGAWRIWRRDHANHASPNSAQGESAFAGALGLRLAGDAYYFGTLAHKPTIGDALRPIEERDIARANHLMVATSICALMVFALLRMAICKLIAAQTGGMVALWLL